MMKLLGMLALAALLGPVSSQHGSHDPALMERGTKGMGFDQHATTHHFTLTKDGGTIEVTANADTDAASASSIRRHLQHIAKAFADGDFALPMFIHAEEPPGAAVLRERKAEMTYRYQEIPKGGRVEIRTADAKALAALHAFLRYQITEHKTGDPTTPK
jgi:hypothetical protein